MRAFTHGTEGSEIAANHMERCSGHLRQNLVAHIAGRR